MTNTDKPSKTERKIMDAVKQGGNFIFIQYMPLFGNRTLRIAEQLRDEGKITLVETYKSPQGYRHYECRAA